MTKTAVEIEAEIYAKERMKIDPIYANGLYYGFLEGAKWQQEQLIKLEKTKNNEV